MGFSHILGVDWQAKDTYPIKTWGVQGEALISRIISLNGMLLFKKKREEEKLFKIITIKANVILTLKIVILWRILIGNE